MRFYWPSPLYGSPRIFFLAHETPLACLPRECCICVRVYAARNNILIKTEQRATATQRSSKGERANSVRRVSEGWRDVIGVTPEAYNTQTRDSTVTIVFNEFP